METFAWDFAWGFAWGFAWDFAWGFAWDFARRTDSVFIKFTDANQ
jgi:hypothetical protein